MNYGRSEGAIQDHLPQMLKDGGEYFSLSFLDTKPALSNYWMIKSPLMLQLYMCMLVSGYKKQGSPLVDIDPSTKGVLNARGYFSYSLGETYFGQREAVAENLAIRKVGTYLFAPVYNLQQARTRARLWSLSMVPVRDNGKWKLFGQAVFGHCSLWPMLPYEILGAITVMHLTAEAAKLPLMAVGYMFQRLSFDNIPPKILKQIPSKHKVTEDCWSTPPSETEAVEILRVESRLRRDPNYRPNLGQPLPAHLRAVIDALQSTYRRGINE